MATVLTLAPAFGGTRFGPFTGGNVSIGSDAQCQVLVSATLGVLPLHAWLTEGAGGWTLHPGAPGAVLFVAKRGGRIAPVSGPVALAAGDGFTLARRDGVAFVIGGATASPTAAARPAAAAARPRPGPRPTIAGPQAARAPTGPRRGPPSAGALVDEAQRMLEVEVMRLGPMQTARRVWFRFQAGTYFQPRYIVGALVALAGSGTMVCAGVAAWVWALL